MNKFAMSIKQFCPLFPKLRCHHGDGFKILVWPCVKSMLHIVSSNKHRDLKLKTFGAGSHSGSAPGDCVMLKLTREKN